MKLFTCAVLAVLAGGLAGCTLDTPAYSAKERYAQIDRNYVSEWKQFNSDIDHYLLARPESQLSEWNVWHRD